MQTAIEQFKNNDFDNSDTNFKSNKGVKNNADVRESQYYAERKTKERKSKKNSPSLSSSEEENDNIKFGRAVSKTKN